MSLQKTKLGYILATKRRGASHRQNNIACQDAYAIASKTIGDKTCIALAVADGHGDAQHDLSQYGSEIAVQNSVDELVAFFIHFYCQENSLSLLIKNFRDNFPRSAGRRWRGAVLQDASNRRLSMAVPNGQINDSQILKRYGTTLLVALVLPEFLLLGQIGDGDILRFFPNGVVEKPFIQDSTELIANYTYSLSSPGVDKLWQTATLARQAGEALLLATDGLSNAFIDESQFHAFARSTLTRINEFGVESVHAALPFWLDDFSARATGDDITLVIFRNLLRSA